MSGGSYDYAYLKIEELAGAIVSHHKGEPLFEAFAGELLRVARVAHEIEWADSGDTSQEDAQAALRQFISPAHELRANMQNAKRAELQLVEAIARAKAVL